MIWSSLAVVKPQKLVSVSSGGNAFSIASQFERCNYYDTCVTERVTAYWNAVNDTLCTGDFYTKIGQVGY